MLLILCKKGPSKIINIQLSLLVPKIPLLFEVEKKHVTSKASESHYVVSSYYHVEIASKTTGIKVVQAFKGQTQFYYKSST